MEDLVKQVKSHGGQENLDGAIFFAPPPPEIGALRSAYTTLKTGDKLYTGTQKLGFALLGGAIGVIVGFAISYFAGVESRFWYFCWPALFGFIGGSIGLGSVTITPNCTYVGENGVARYIQKKTLDFPPTEEILKFTDAAELHVSLTRNYRNSAYTGTSYVFNWYGGGGFIIAGTYSNEQGPPADSYDYYHFATAAEQAWSQYVLQKYIGILENNGSVDFKTVGDIGAASNNPKHAFILRLGQNFIELVDLSRKGKDGDNEKWHFDDLLSISLKQGYIYVEFKTMKERGIFARLIGKSKFVDSSVSYVISYWQMPNARVFSLLCQHLLPDKTFIS